MRRSGGGSVKIPALPSIFTPRGSKGFKEPTIKPVKASTTTVPKFAIPKIAKSTAPKTTKVKASTAIAPRATYPGPTGGQGTAQRTPGPKAVSQIPFKNTRS